MNPDVNATWFACHHPERPTDPLVRWHYGHCTPCHLKALAVQAMHPDAPGVAFVVAATEPAEDPS